MFDLSIFLKSLSWTLNQQPCPIQTDPGWQFTTHLCKLQEMTIVTPQSTITLQVSKGHYKLQGTNSSVTFSKVDTFCKLKNSFVHFPGFFLK